MFTSEMRLCLWNKGLRMIQIYLSYDFSRSLWCFNQMAMEPLRGVIKYIMALRAQCTAVSPSNLLGLSSLSLSLESAETQLLFSVF